MSAQSHDSLSPGQAFEKILSKLVQPGGSLSANEAASNINEIVHANLTQPPTSSADTTTEGDDESTAINPGGIIWELWDQLCRCAQNTPCDSDAQAKLVNLLPALEQLPKWNVTQKGLRDSYEIELWTNVTDLGHRPLKEWLWEFSECMSSA